MSSNVPVVYDVFAVAMTKLRSSFSNRKNVVEQKCTKRSPTAFLRNPSPERGEAYTVLLRLQENCFGSIFFLFFHEKPPENAPNNVIFTFFFR
jgi:hypothetical protein